MKRVVIFLPDEVADRVTVPAILDLIEAGASRHALIRMNWGDDANEYRHSRLGVTIVEQRLVEVPQPGQRASWDDVEAHFPAKAPEGKR